MGKFLDSSEPVGHTCPTIDSGIDIIDCSIREIKSIIDIFEEIRSANSALREWGINWVNRANELEEEVYQLQRTNDENISKISDLEQEVIHLYNELGKKDSEINKLNDTIDTIKSGGYHDYTPYR